MSFTPGQRDLLAEAAEAIADINLQIAELTEQKNAFLEVFKNEENGITPQTEAYQFGKCLVKVTASSRLDDGLARRELDPETYDLVSKVVLDTALARKVLKDSDLEKISKKYDNKVEVRIK